MSALPVYAVLIVVCLCSSGYAADTPKEIPKDIVPILTAYEADAKKAWDAYQAALQKAEDKAKKDFGAKMAPALKKGDLDTANAIKSYLDKVTSGEAVVEYEATWKAAKKDADLLGDSKPLVILEATWGVPGRTADVTDLMKKQIKQNRLLFVHDPEIHHGLFSQIPDPAPFTFKTVTIRYSVNGKVTTAEVARGMSVDIPAGK